MCDYTIKKYNTTGLTVLILVNHEQPFKDKCFLYRFWQDEEGATALPTLEDITTAEDQLQESLTALIHRGPDAMMRMILRKPLVANFRPSFHT